MRWLPVWIIVILWVVLALGGCTAAPVAPVEPTRIKEVPVPVPCVGQIPEAPVLVHDQLDSTFPLDVLYGSALKDKTALELYAGKLLIQVKACSVIPK